MGTGRDFNSFQEAVNEIAILSGIDKANLCVLPELNPSPQRQPNESEADWLFRYSRGQSVMRIAQMLQHTLEGRHKAHQEFFIRKVMTDECTVKELNREVDNIIDMIINVGESTDE